MADVNIPGKQQKENVAMTITLGILSDTHGLLRPAVLSELDGCDFILHAGDIGGPDILEQLEKIAQVHAVQGNMDGGAWCRNLPPTEIVEVDNYLFYILHDLFQIDLDPMAAGIDVVISGHTHLPSLTRKGTVLYLNPGSAGPRRTGRPVSMVKMIVDNRGLHPELIALQG